MIIDEFQSKGYIIRLVDGYDVRVINPFGKKIKNVPAHAKNNPKWKKFKDLRSKHRKEITKIKHEFLRSMLKREEIDLYNLLRKTNRYSSTSITMADLFSVVENMYVEAKMAWIHEEYGWRKEVVNRGFVTGCDDGKMLVDGKQAECIRMLHPSEIDDLFAIQTRAIVELRDTHIMQLFRPTFVPEIDEEYCVTRFMEIPIESKKAVMVIDSYSWGPPKYRDQRGVIEGTAIKYFESHDEKYLVKWQYSLDWPRKKKVWECGAMEFFTCRKMPKECPPALVDPVVFSEAVWEIQKIVDACRVDDEISRTTMTYRQSVASIYIDALGLDNCEVIGSTVKIYGEWGIYGVSLKDGRSMWWSNKKYICIQPTTGHENPKYGAFVVGDGVLDDPVLALAVAKIRDLSDDTHPVDEVEGRQIRPHSSVYAQDGMKLEDVRKEKEIFQQGGKTW